MILCIPTNDNRGIDARLSAHFGRAPWFTIVNSATGSVDLIRNDPGHHVHGACVPTEEIVRRGVEGVLCRGIGQGASARLAAAGIAVYLTDETITSSGIEALNAGKVRRLDGTGACSDDHHSVC